MDKLDRLLRLQQKLSHLGITCLLIEQPLSLLYLTGLHLSAGQLLLTVHGSALFVDGRYLEAAGRQSQIPVHKQAPDALRSWCKSHGIRTVHMIAEHTTVARAYALEADLAVDHIQLEPIADPVVALRRIKDASEIADLRKAAQLTAIGIAYAESLLAEGVRESQIALEMEIFWRRSGGEKLAFEPIIAFGSNSSMPHYRAGFTQLGQHDAVLIDAGVVMNGYHGDCTRFFPRHHCPPQLMAAHAAVLEAQQEAIRAIQPGVPLGYLDRVARDVLRKHSLEVYFTHSLGHGIGLEIHESPRIKEDGPDASMLCQPGMVFTIEPGVYLPGIGGVRLEETVIVHDKGCEVLTRVPDKIFD
jgi:Xaa-Pro aminopeptidase